MISHYIFLQICLSCICFQPVLLLGERIFQDRGFPAISRQWTKAAIVNGIVILLTAQISVWMYL